MEGERKGFDKTKEKKIRDEKETKGELNENHVNL